MTNSPFRNQPHLLVNVDWLTLRLDDTLSDRKFHDGVLVVTSPGPNPVDFQIELTGQGTRFFNHLAKIYYGQTCIAEVQFGVRFGHVTPQMHIKYENFVFYDSDFMGAESKYGIRQDRHIFDRLFHALGSPVRGITRLDIAVDGCDLASFLNDFVQKGAYEQLKVRTLAARCEHREGCYVQTNVTPLAYCMTTHQFRGFQAGTRGGKKFLRYYDKTQEIADKGGKKSYILDYFTANGFDVSKGVNRFELELHSEAFQDMDGFVYSSDIFNFQTLVDILNFQLRNFFEFVPAVSSDSRKSRRPRVQLFDFQYIPLKYVRVKRSLLEGTRTAKIIISRLVRDAYLSDDETHAYSNFSTVREMLMRYHLEQWITARGAAIMDGIEKHARVRGIPINKSFSGKILHDVENYSLHFN